MPALSSDPQSLRLSISQDVNYMLDIFTRHLSPEFLVIEEIHVGLQHSLLGQYRQICVAVNAADGPGACYCFRDQFHTSPFDFDHRLSRVCAP